jgi:hypothetical protein
VMLPSWLFALLLGFSLCTAVNLTLQLLPEASTLRRWWRSVAPHPC